MACATLTRWRGVNPASCNFAEGDGSRGMHLPGFDTTVPDLVWRMQTATGCVIRSRSPVVDAEACNFAAAATDEDGSCTYPARRTIVRANATATPMATVFVTNWNPRDARTKTRTITFQLLRTTTARATRLAAWTLRRAISIRSPTPLLNALTRKPAMIATVFALLMKTVTVSAIHSRCWGALIRLPRISILMPPRTTGRASLPPSYCGKARCGMPKLVNALATAQAMGHRRVWRCVLRRF